MMKQMLWGAMAATVLGVAAPVNAQNRDRDRDGDDRSESRFTWSGALGEGRQVTLRNVNGGVRIEPGTGRTVEVVATKSWRRGNPDRVRIEARATSAGDVVICALWNESSSCDERGYRQEGRTSWRRTETNDVSVQFVVLVPADARVNASTVNGGVTIEGIGGDVEVETVNGAVEAQGTRGRVRAETVNGSITIRAANLGAHDIEYETVNGSITIELPSDANLDLDLRTVNGRVRSEFPMTLEGEINPRRIRASIGSGGRLLRASTVNGSIQIERH